MEIRYGKQFQARLDVEELFAEYVRFNVADSTLTVEMDERKIPMDVKKMFRGKDGAPAFRIIVTMPEYLRTLRLQDRAVLLGADDLVVAASGLDITVTDNARIASFSLGASRVYVGLDRKAEANMKISSDSLSVRLGGSASLTLEQHALSSAIDVSGTASLLLKGSAKSMDINAKGSSKSILNGVVPQLRYQVSGMANVNAVNLESEKARVTMSGLCTLVQAASDELEVDLSSGSTLSFLHSPAIRVLQVKNASMHPYEAAE
ncbi:MAG: DUF2807 domain-containing protein [Bacteroidales bacterium]|nr:DUF2807 domain-containing protein [Bacteroidales bacterium]